MTVLAETLEYLLVWKDEGLGITDTFFHPCQLIPLSSLVKTTIWL